MGVSSCGCSKAGELDIESTSNQSKRRKGKSNSKKLSTQTNGIRSSIVNKKLDEEDDFANMGLHGTEGSMKVINPYLNDESGPDNILGGSKAQPVDNGDLRKPKTDVIDMDFGG